ncbi:MAG: hypothetical protein HC850_11690 [Rhodomicrobium sp.]|nr:hypothetical protein [Rhodomicrobium sp.]
MFKLILSAIGIVIIVIGLIIFPMPIPFGAFLILLGCALLVSSSETAAHLLKRLRARYSRLNGFIAMLEARSPGVLARALRRTAPDGANP